MREKAYMGMLTIHLPTLFQILPCTLRPSENSVLDHIISVNQRHVFWGMAQYHVLWFYRWIILKSIIFKSIFLYRLEHWLEVYSTVWLNTALYWNSCDKLQEKWFQERMFIFTDASIYDILMGKYFFSCQAKLQKLH